MAIAGTRGDDEVERGAGVLSFPNAEARRRSDGCRRLGPRNAERRRPRGAAMPVNAQNPAIVTDARAWYNGVVSH
jgi:hypothetical protein